VKAFPRARCLLAVLGAGLVAMATARADTPHFYRVASPDHEQTFAFGTETNRVWAVRGADRYLAVLLNFTNDPYVDRLNPRQYDNFTFGFPAVTLDKDRRTFTYRTPNGRIIPVAEKRPGFLRLEEIRLLPNATLIVRSPHGYLSLVLVIEG
jgi:hypothetical protein